MPFNILSWNLFSLQTNPYIPTISLYISDVLTEKDDDILKRLCMSRAKCEQRMMSVINYYKKMTIENFIAQTTQLFETTDYIRNENEKWKDNIDISRVHRYDDINKILSDMFVQFATTHNDRLTASECINWFDKSISPMTATFKLKKLKKLSV